MAAMTSTTMANWTPAVWSTKPTITYRSNVVNVPLLNHDWEPEIGVGRGDRVNIPGFTQNNAARNRGAGTGTFGTEAAVTLDANTESQTQLVVNRWYYKAFGRPVEAGAQTMPNYLTLLLKGHGEAIALAVDSDIASDNTDGFDSFTAIGTDNVDITEDDLLTADTNLNNQNVPITDRFGVFSPASINSLRKVEAFRNSLYQGALGNIPAGKGAGFMTKLLTFDVYMSNNLEAGTSGKKNFIGHREAIAYAEQLSLRAEHVFNLRDGATDEYISFMTCGFKVVKSAFGNEVDGK